MKTFTTFYASPSPVITRVWSRHPTCCPNVFIQMPPFPEAPLALPPRAGLELHPRLFRLCVHTHTPLLPLPFACKLLVGEVCPVRTCILPPSGLSTGPPLECQPVPTSATVERTGCRNRSPISGTVRSDSTTGGSVMLAEEPNIQANNLQPPRAAPAKLGQYPKHPYRDDPRERHLRTNSPALL